MYADSGDSMAESAHSRRPLESRDSGFIASSGMDACVSLAFCGLWRLLSYIWLVCYLKWLTANIVEIENRRSGGIFYLHLQDRRIRVSRVRSQCESSDFLLGLFFDGGDMFLETSVDFQRIIWCYILEDRTPYNHRCENPKSYVALGKAVPLSMTIAWSGL
jgi:hypothetical protein